MSESGNPYSPPLAEVADAPHTVSDGGTFVPNGRRVPAGNGVSWMTRAFRLFFQAPGKWLLVLLILFAIYFVSGLIPFAGFVIAIFGPVIGGGIVYSVHLQRTTGSFDIGNIFAGFGPRFGQLVIVGLVVLLNIPLTILAFLIVFGADIVRMFTMVGDQMDPMMFDGFGMKILLVVLLNLLFTLPILAATYLAPALIMLHEIPAGAAMKMSFIGLIKNVLPGLVFSVLMLLVGVVALIPIGLGLLIVVPVAMIAAYTMYRDIFVEEAE